MASSKNELDLTVFKLMGDQHENEVFFVFDLAAGKFLYLNNAFESMWKRRAEEVKENPASLLDTLHPDDVEHVKDHYDKFVAEPSKMLLSFRIEWPYTDTLWLRLSAYPLEHDDQSQLMAGIVENDSPRMKSIFNMQKVNARKNSMLDILSHDLRGPIGIVQTLAAVIEEELPESDSDNSRKQLQIIQQICQRNIDLIKDLVHNEFLESAEVEVNKERLDLVWEINEVIKYYRNAQQNLKKVFELTTSQEKVYSRIDSMKFMQVINNLLSNAIKFTHDNGHIRIHIERTEETILITVSDDGIGIPEKLQPFLFDKFTKARRVGLNGEEPVGLGMSIIKSVIEMLGGKIWFESKENKGTTFFMELSNEE